MTLSISKSLVLTAFCGFLPLLTPAMSGQDPPPPRSAPAEGMPKGWRRFSFGFLVSGYPLDVIEDRKLERSDTTGSVAKSWTYTTTSSSSRAAPGLRIEFALRPRLTLGVEAIHHPAGYKKVTDFYQGTDDPNTTADERTKTTFTETSKATFWDIPLTLRYHGLRRSGLLSKAFVCGGAALRTVANVRTTNEVDYPDGSNSYDEIPTLPDKRNVVGTVLGVGLRFTDDFNIKVTPEVRYTHWFGSNFNSDSTLIRKQQIEVGLGLTF
jgi:hypothetical protein